ncbi:hypothetical protein ACJRO7_008655 [Eucalyptus globulus]|uniref:Uncharacterized protein n=1 Tax=Eucalyptus globulus TaxID=34317 RepID=A0ABD3ISA2_EUCGL
MMHDALKSHFGVALDGGASLECGGRYGRCIGCRNTGGDSWGASESKACDSSHGGSGCTY